MKLVVLVVACAAACDKGAESRPPAAKDAAASTYRIRACNETGEHITRLFLNGVFLGEMQNHECSLYRDVRYATTLYTIYAEMESSGPYNSVVDFSNPRLPPGSWTYVIAFRGGKTITSRDRGMLDATPHLDP